MRFVRDNEVIVRAASAANNPQGSLARRSSVDNNVSTDASQLALARALFVFSD